MKLLYLHQYFIFPRQGGGTRSYDLAKKFVEAGHQVEFVASTNDPKFKKKPTWTIVEKEGIKVHYYYLPYSNELSYSMRILLFVKFSWVATRKALRIQSDLVLATSTPLSIGFPALIKKKLNGTPYIFEVRDVWPEIPIAMGVFKNKYVIKFLYWFEKKIYKNAEAVVPLSIGMKNSILTRFPILKQKRMPVIENLAVLDRFKFENRQSDFIQNKIGMHPRFSILYAGTFGRINGVGYVVDLAEKLVKIDPSIVFILVGSGYEKTIIKQAAIEKKVIDKNLFILDFLPKKEIIPFFNSVDMGASFFIDLKEMWANSANKFFDTLAAGKPPLINYGGWQKELIEKENLGYVLPPSPTLKEVQDFVTYTKNYKLQDLQSNNCLRVAKKNFSLEKAASIYLNLFKQCIPN